jgi:hypothetical protein
MAITLAESAKLSTNQVYRGVVQTAYTHSDILKYLQWEIVRGNALQYARENTASTASVYDPGETIAESTMTTTQVTVALKRIIGDAQVDAFAAATRSDHIDQTAVQIAAKTRAVASLYEQLFITGDTATNSKQFDGLRVLVNGGQRISMGANGGSLTLAALDQLIDTCSPRPDLLVMTHRSRRKLAALMRAAGSVLETRAEFGTPISLYAGIPIAISNHITDTLTKGTSTDCSEIYAVSLQPGTGVVGLQGETGSETIERPDVGTLTLPGPQVIDLGPSETVDARRYRVRWYAALALYSTRAAACLDGVQD